MQVNQHEMNRKAAVTRVTGLLLERIESCDTELTHLEWLEVLQRLQKWVLDEALKEEWAND